MDTPIRITFPVASFRHLESPFAKQGYHDYFTVVAVQDLPDLSEWREINVRDPKLTGRVPNAIRESVKENPELFMFMNRGIAISVESVSFDQKTSQVTISMRNPKLHGLLDGGHTYNILLEERQSLESPQYVRVEFLEGFKPEDIGGLVDARNTSNQVRDQSLMNLEGKFDLLRRTLTKRRYADLIAYKEFEVDAEGDPKPIDVREIIAILTVFDREHFDDRTHPINAYRSKAWCLDHFKQHFQSYEKIYPLANDLLELYDQIHKHLPALYNDARRKGEDVAGGKFGRLTGVTTYAGKAKAKLLFIGEESKYGVPDGFVYPILGAFRAFLEEKNGCYVWGQGIDPLKLLQGKLGEELAETIGIFALDARNPSKTGKSPLVWQSCYQAGRVASLELMQRQEKLAI